MFAPVLADAGAYPELTRAAALPVGAELFALLDSINTRWLDDGGQIRLAQQWARLEAAASGRKLAAIAAMAGPEPTIEELAENRGQPNFTDFEIGAALTLGATSAQKLTTAARALANQMTQALTALRAGELHYLQALKYAEAADGLTTEQCDRVQELTLGKATTKTPWQLRQLLRKTVIRVGAEDLGKKHEVQKKSTDIRVQPEDDGMSSLHGWLTSVDATIVDAAVEAYARAKKGAGDERSLGELRAAGLVEMAERYLMDPAGPRAHGRPITVDIAIDFLTFLGLTNHPGEILGTGQMIPAEALRELIPQAALRRIITDPMTGELLDYGRTTYRFPADTTAYAIAKWVSSTGPGSTVPAQRVDMDHGKPWADGGETSRDNGNPADRRWHRAKTIGGWTVFHSDDGWTWRSPLGIESKTSPHDYRLGP